MSQSSQQGHVSSSGVPNYQNQHGRKFGGGHGTTEGGGGGEGTSGSSSWQRSYQNRSTSRAPRNTSTNTRGGGRDHRNTGGRGGAATTVSMTAAGARVAAMKCVNSGNYRGAVKVLAADAARTGVLTEKCSEGETFDLLQVLSTMVQRNLYPEIAQLIKIVWLTTEDKKNIEMRQKLLNVYSPKELVKRLVTAHYHEAACRSLSDFSLMSDVDTTTFVLEHLLKAGQFDRAMTLSKSLKYPNGYEANLIVQCMIDRGNVSTALKHLYELRDKSLKMGSSADGGADGNADGGADGGADGSADQVEGQKILELFDVEELIEKLFHFLLKVYLFFLLELYLPYSSFFE